MNKIIFGVITVVIVVAAIIIYTNQYAAGKYEQGNTASLNESATMLSPIQSSLVTSGEKEKEATILVTSAGFEPSAITVQASTKVTWINQSGSLTNVSSDVHPTHLLYPSLNLGSFDTGQSVSLVFDTAGTHGYHNHLKPSEKGTVIIE